MSAPTATVRLQLRREFTFDDAAGTVDYYARLGISHFYLSPIFTAREGSAHGYDVVDPTRINPELGGEEALLRLVARLRAAGMGVVIDIVPNHMGVAPGSNRYWNSVLQWGPQSPYVEWFDIDLQSNTPHLHGKMLLPVLGDVYDAVLRAGDLRLHPDIGSGRLELAYHDNRFPLAPASIADILGSQTSLANLADAFAGASPDTIDQACTALREATKTPGTAQAINAAMAPYTADSADGQTRLHALLQRQHYRLSWWRNAAEEINWRRFFEVSDLAGVRVELEPVFDATHTAVFDLYRRGLIDGVRIDHVDGLADPAGYCRRLRNRLDALQAERPAPLHAQRAWIVVEKILTPGEALPADWQIDGTSGYDFMDQVGELLHDGSGDNALRKVWKELTGDHADFENHVQGAREQLLRENFVGELNALVHALHRYATCAPPRGRDITERALLRVVTALLAAFRRYRCYSSGSATSEEDRRVLHQAALHAQASLHLPDHDLLNRVAGWLGLDAETDADEAARKLRERAITRFQQLTPPLAAKSVEDTAFYRHAPLLSRNDVGSYPQACARGVSAFHEVNLRRAADFPRALLATATHDHKRGEDVRARLAVLSEIPDIWADTLRCWTSAHRHLKATVEAPGGGHVQAPLLADEIMLYQTLLGAWPTDLQPADTAGVAEFAARALAWQEKSLREAKLLSSWMLPNQAYEAACANFLQNLLDGDRQPSFPRELASLLKQIQPAAEANSLTQTLLRLTSPGVPDLYQGCEFEDLSLVDPDNRRPIDMAARAAALGQPSSRHRKQQLLHTVLNCRKQHARLFEVGNYRPLEVTGTTRDHVVAFAQCLDEQIFICVAMRLPFSMLSGTSQGWGDTAIALPEEFPADWRDVISMHQINTANSVLPLSGTLDAWSVALLLPCRG